MTGSSRCEPTEKCGLSRRAGSAATDIHALAAALLPKTRVASTMYGIPWTKLSRGNGAKSGESTLGDAKRLNVDTIFHPY